LFKTSSTVDPDVFLKNVAIRLFGDMAMIGRSVSAQLTSPSARKQGINISAFTTVWSGIDAHAKLANWVRKRAQDLFEKLPFSSEIWITTNVCGRVGYTEVIDKAIREKLQEAKYANDMEQVQVLEALALESDERVFHAQLELSEALRPHNHSKILALGGTLLMALPACINKLLSVPAYEEGTTHFC
jgi:hypothetical protein